jgi:hypothetical protein
MKQALRAADPARGPGSPRRLGSVPGVAPGPSSRQSHDAPRLESRLSHGLHGLRVHASTGAGAAPSAGDVLAQLRLTPIGGPPLVQRACGPAAIGAPAGCTAGAATFQSNYPLYRFDPDCDDLSAGEQARLVTEVNALGASARFELHGYASSTGDATFNRNVSCARALRAQDVLTSAGPTGAGISAARVTGIVAHGGTPGPSASRRSVVLAPPTPAPVPSAVPAAGATDFLIDRVGTSTPSQIFFARGASTLDANATAQITAIKALAPASVRLIGYASADEAASVALDRANAIRAALTAAPNAVVVSAATGNAGATATRSDFTASRSVEVLIGAASASTLDCAALDALGNPVNPPRQPCSAMDPPTETAFNAALVVANDAMSRATAAVAGVPNGVDEPVIDRFFGNHSGATLSALRTNLGNLQTHVSNLPASTSCGGQCDIGGCSEGPIAYNSDVDAASTMTLCVPVFKGMHLNDQARNLVHESAHGTSPLGGTPSTGTRDVAYRHERMLFQLAPADRLRNSDSYALFALFLREVQMTGAAGAVPAGISTPASDSITGFSAAETPVVELALAQMEKRLTWAKDWVGQLYGQVNRVRSGALTWSASWAERLMTEAAARFPLTAPPGIPTTTDQARLASILERYTRMKLAGKADLNVARMAAGTVNWPVAGTWVAGHDLDLGPDFFRATAPHQISLLVQNLAQATRDVEAAFVPAYVSLAEWIHLQNP